MKKNYTILFLLFINLISLNTFALSQASSTCSDEFLVSKSSNKEYYNGAQLAVNEIVTTVVTLPNSNDSALITITSLGIKSGDKLMIYDGAYTGVGDVTLKGISGGLASGSIVKVSSSGNIFTIRYTNGATGGGDASEFSVSWQGLINNTQTITNNCSVGGSTGAAQIEPVGGTAPYTYSWQGLTTTSYKIQNKPAGTYYCTVTDANSCKAIDTIIIQAPTTNLSASETSRENACFGLDDGEITVTGLNGYGGYSYKWSDNVTTNIRTDLGKGTYTYTVTDAESCTYSDTVKITQPAAALVATITETQGISCNSSNSGIHNNGILTVSKTGGYTLVAGSCSWSNSNTGFSISNLSAANYSCTITDNNGCVASASYTLSEPTFLSATADVDQDISCNNLNGTNSDGILSVLATGGTGTYTYNWGSGSTTSSIISGLTQGNYTCTVTDSKSCIASSNSVSISDPTAIALSSVDSSNYNNWAISCYGKQDGWIKVAATGGTGTIDYRWGANSGYQQTDSAISLKSGSYSYTATDDNGCTLSGSYILHSPDQIVISGTVTNATYNGGNDGAIAVTVTGDTVLSATKDWSGSNVVDGYLNQSNLKSGLYSITLTDQNLCSATKTFEILEPSETDGGEVSSSGVYICHSGQVEIAFSNVQQAFDSTSVTYSWQYSPNAITWLTIASSNNIAYTFAPSDTVTQDIYIRRKAVKGTDIAYSNQVMLDYVDSTILNIYNIKDTYCANADSVLIVGVPFNNKGAFLSMSGLTDKGDGTAYLDPALIDITSGNTVQISYTYTQNGCVTQKDFEVTIDSVTTPSFEIGSKYSDRYSSVDITNISPLGGDFYGSSIVATDTSATFYPSELSAGIYEIRYEYTNSYGCVGSYSKNVEIVTGSGNIFYAADNTTRTKFCIDDDSVRFVASADYKIKSGAYTNSFISTYDTVYGVFSPRQAFLSVASTNDESASIDITYDYTSDSGSFTIILPITIYNVAGYAIIKDLSSVYCQTGQTVTINANTLETGESGQFICSNGLTATSNSITFDIDDFTANVYGSDSTSLTYIYTHSDDESKCTDTVTKWFHVYALDSVGFVMKDLYNVDEAEVSLTNYTPSTAVFSGSGIITTNSTTYSYYPKSAGVGSHTITLTYRNTNTGCINSSNKIVEVDTAQGSFNIVNGKIFCYKGEVDTIVAYPSNGATGLSGSFSIATINQYGIDSIGADSIQINPGLFQSTGSVTLTYTYLGIDSITEFELTLNVYIDNLGVLGISGIDDAYCISDDDVSLTGLIGSSAANYGFFLDSCSAVVTGSYDGTGTFSPSKVKNGSDLIGFVYTSQHAGSACADTVLKSVTVYALPVLTFDLPQIYNQEGEVDTLMHYVTPQGGAFTGEGIIGNAVGAFNPGKFTVNTITSVTYTYQDPTTSCVNDSISTTSVQFASASISGVTEGQVFCYGDASVDLSVTGENTGSLIGSYSGLGIIDNADGSAVLNPKNAYDLSGSSSGDVELTIVYTYNVVRNNDTAEFETTRTYTINNLTNITFTIEAADTAVCKDEDVIVLTNTVNASGGAFYIENASGDILLTDDEFDPAEVEAGKNVILFKYTGSSCSTVLKDTIDVHSIPTPDFDFVTQMCENDSIILLGQPRGGEFSGQSFTYLNSLKDSVLFKALNAGGLDYSFNYYYKDEYGCTATETKTIPVYDNPVLSFSDNFEEEFCINGSSVNIYGKNKNNQVSSGLFSGTNIDDTDDDGSYLFDPTIYEAGKYSISFSYTNSDGCSSSITQKITINEKPDVAIEGLDASNYCPYSNSTVSIYCSPSYNGSVNNGLNINGTLFPKSQVTFSPKDYTQGDSVEFIYIYTDANGCTNKDTVSVRINYLPVSEFEVPNTCISEPIEFYYTGGTQTDSIASFLWKFDVSDDSSTVENPKYTYTEPNNDGYDVSLTIINTDGCEDESVQNIDFDYGPVADFSWNYECLGSTLEFENLTDKEVDSWEWTIDGQTLSSKSPTYTFSKEGEYEVTLKAIESEKCSSDTTKTVSIRPIVTIDADNAYFTSFEDDYDGWAAELINDSDSITWVNTTPAASIINSAYNGENAWVTNPYGNYKNYEQSAITSPCFILSDLKRPMISLWYWSACKDNDGAVLQYRVEGDDTWETVGTIDNGINWYSSYEINGEPGGNSQGWTGDSEGWVNAMHDLNELKGTNEMVRFRIAFGADQSSVSEGFAFDDVTIGERQRRILLEHFTNISSAKSATTNDDVNTLVSRYPLDVIDIQYHTSSPSGDELYYDYPAGSTVRASYYNIQEIPYAYLNGNNVFDYSASDDDQSNDLLNISMISPDFSMTLETYVLGNTLSITNNIEALQEVADRQLHVITAIVEKEVTISGSSVVYQNVLRGIVPNPSGTYISNNWTKGENLTLSNEFTIDSDVEDADMLNVIAFIQDEESHEILQVVTTDTTSVSTGVDQLFSNSSSFDFIVYPNPASVLVNVVLSQETTENSTMQIFDQQGKIIDQVELEDGSRVIPFNVDGLSKGIYMISISTNNKKVTKKLVIMR